MPSDDNQDIKIKLFVREYVDDLPLNIKQIEGVTNVVKTSQSAFQERFGERLGHLERNEGLLKLGISALETKAKTSETWIRGLALALFAALATTLGSLYVQSKTEPAPQVSEPP